jgi:outer membrane protein
MHLKTSTWLKVPFHGTTLALSSGRQKKNPSPHAVNKDSCMKKRLFLIVVLFVFAPAAAGAEELLKNGEMLDLQRCIAIALKRQPNILAAQNTVRVNESRIGQAKANYYPQVNVSAGYSRNYTGSSSSVYGTKSPYNDYSSSVNLSQNIYDFEKTSTQVKIQSLNRDSSRQDLANVSSQIVFAVKQAYFALLSTMKNRDVAEETVRQFQSHLDRARGFFEVGMKPKFDVTKAEVDLSNARLNLITAANNVRIARVNLNNSIGLPEAPDYTIEDNLAFQPYEIGFEEALKRAYANRPDLQSVLLKKESLEKSIDLAKKGYYPALTGNANYGFDGQDLPLDKGWMVGATLSFPIFSGLSTKYQVDEARANLDVQKANEEVLRQSIHLDVQQAWLNLQVARDRISTAELAVRQAAENLDLANGRYAAGVGNPIEVTDALVAQSNAKTAHVAALYDYKLAKASMEKAMGVQ